MLEVALVLLVGAVAFSALVLWALKPHHLKEPMTQPKPQPMGASASEVQAAFGVADLSPYLDKRRREQEAERREQEAEEQAEKESLATSQRTLGSTWLRWLPRPLRT